MPPTADVAALAPSVSMGESSHSGGSARRGHAHLGLYKGRGRRLAPNNTPPTGPPPRQRGAREGPPAGKAREKEQSERKAGASGRMNEAPPRKRALVALLLVTSTFTRYIYDY